MCVPPIMSLRRSVRISTSVSIPVQQAAQAATSQSLRKRKADTVDIGKPKKKPKKNSVAAATTNDVQKIDPLDGPVTPARTKRLALSRVTKGEPLTPTPALVNILRAPYSTGDIDDATPPPDFEDRLADPHLTNATLITPGGSKATALPSHARSQKLINPSPSKQPTTTSTLLEKAQAHLVSIDPRFETLIQTHRCAIFGPEGLNEEIDPFRSLVSGICGQQVSGAAAKSIKNKFVALYNEGSDGVHVWPVPSKVAKTSIEKLRTAGLSQRKAEYIQGLAEKFESGELTTKMLLQASDEEVMEKLIAVRGLGKWSVEM